MLPEQKIIGGNGTNTWPQVRIGTGASFRESDAVVMGSFLN